MSGLLLFGACGRLGHGRKRVKRAVVYVRFETFVATCIATFIVAWSEVGSTSRPLAPPTNF